MPRLVGPSFDVQTRNHSGEIQFFDTLKEALKVSETDRDVWKISFPLESGERFRMIREGDIWKMDLIDMEKIEKEFKNSGGELG